MKVDVYKRPENPGHFSYLAVPEGKPIPNEATSIEWETAAQSIDLDEDNQPLDGLSAEDALHQIDLKGYAISSLNHKKVIGPVV